MTICHPPEPRSLIWLWSYENDPDTTFWGAAEAGSAWFNRTAAVFKYWDGIDVHVVGTGGAVWSSIASNPQVGEYRIKDVRLDASKHIVIVYDSIPEVAPTVYPTILSNPGSGEYRVIALRLDASKHIVVVYDSTPEP